MGSYFMIGLFDWDVMQGSFFKERLVLEGVQLFSLSHFYIRLWFTYFNLCTEEIMKFFFQV